MTLTPCPRPSHDPSWVPAAPARKHLQLLLHVSDLPWRAIALVADVPPLVVQRLLFGRDGRHIPRIRHCDAQRILRVDGPSLQRLLNTPVTARSVRSPYRHLLRHADAETIARATGVDLAVLAQITSRRERIIPGRAALQIRAAAQAHGWTVDNDQTRVPASVVAMNADEAA